MCGIFGAVRLDGAPTTCGSTGALGGLGADLGAATMADAHPPISSIDLDMALAAISHRGPDARGVWRGPHAVLGHARLSIIDLTPTGAQPMFDREGLAVVVFNGEIYNHHELRAELTALGHRFRGRSDT